MKIGTSTLLVGYHQFLLHPMMVALAWWKLFGFPFDPRLWFAFFLHDIGYLGKPDIDGPDGSSHPFVGANIMHWMFDFGLVGPDAACYWYKFCLYHSRTLAKTYFAPLSKLGYADKLAFLLYPKWLVKFLYWLSGEDVQYLKDSGAANLEEWYQLAASGNIKTLDIYKDKKLW